MKVTDRSRNDFEFFVFTPLNMVGEQIGVWVTSDQDGKTALECWYAKDTHGQVLPCREPELLSKAMRGKASWNLQIRMWAESIAEETLFQWELIDYCHGLPAWIFDATMQQANKILKERGDFTKRFQCVHTVKGQWWPPWMHDWMPEI